MKKVIFASIIAFAGYTQIQTSEIRFKPADQFAAPGTNGIYYKDLQAARIENPSSGLLYEFTDVVSGGINSPSGLIQIGSYSYSPPAVNGIKRMGVRLINLYGILVDREAALDNDALQAQPAIPGNNPNTYSPQPIINDDNTQTQRAMPGSNPNTYAPIIFTPADEIAASGMIGNYFPSSQIATIHSAAASNNEADRLFTNVIATNDRNVPAGYQAIGYYSAQPAASAMSFAQLMTYLYGQEQI